MKPIRFLYLPVLLLLSLPLLAPSCSNKNSDPVPAATHPASVASVWAWQKLQVSPPVGNIDDILDFYIQLNLITSNCLPIFLYEFKSDGTVVPLEQTICASSGNSALEMGPQMGDT
ncbi:hypothetical protein [Spirosoma luteum]|uniref:hypothetical protein n=1 Tax=Spirosoma luteum TaxID=431553 RepID=UPI00035C0E54|nr:hypothetical protein [Spirosoma luteum]